MYARNYFHQTSVVASRIIIFFASRLIQQIKFKSDGYGQEIKKKLLIRDNQRNAIQVLFVEN